MQTLQQCAAERYLISLIIPLDRPPPPDCPSPNFPLYRAHTDQINSADARGSPLLVGGESKIIRPVMPALTEEWAMF